MTMTEDEFSEWFDHNIGTQERFGAAYQTYEALCLRKEQQIQQALELLKNTDHKPMRMCVEKAIEILS